MQQQPNMMKIQKPGDKSALKPRPLILQHSNANKIVSNGFMYGRPMDRKSVQFPWNKALDNSLLDLHSRFGSQWQLILQMLPPFAVKNNRARLTVELVKKRYKDLQSRRIAKQVCEYNYLHSKEQTYRDRKCKPNKENETPPIPPPLEEEVMAVPMAPPEIPKQQQQSSQDSNFTLFNFEDEFAVQTPTKAIGESERLSFHLLQHCSNDLFESKATLTPRQKRESESLLEVTTHSPKRIKQEAPINKKSPELSFQCPLEASVDENESWENPTMIALNTAKVTAINRLLVQAKERKLKQRFEAMRAQRQVFSLARKSLAPGENSIPSISVPQGCEPHFSTRRVIQIGCEEAWKQKALGLDHVNFSMEEKAKAVLGMSDNYEGIETPKQHPQRVTITRSGRKSASAKYSNTR
ncbi:hypothetical protein Ciccas_003296 [Cichlidogyrus casuarinus]|uniref:Myb-like domain-containing protein n=1 Tax=Cichlidogyrus casuarinus TaxID=1844966 RepID=A0ABD2QES0_9PLAT